MSEVGGVNESVIEFLVEGEWLKPIDPPVTFQHHAAFDERGWTLTTALEFNHSEHGRIFVVPHTCPARLAA